MDKLTVEDHDNYHVYDVDEEEQDDEGFLITTGSNNNNSNNNNNNSGIAESTSSSTAHPASPTNSSSMQSQLEDSFAMMPKFKVLIVGTEQRASSTPTSSSASPNDMYTVYILEVRCEGLGAPWTVGRRFKEFATLYSMLRKQYPRLNFPSLPARTFLQNKLTTRVVEARRTQLQTFLNYITTGSHDEDNRAHKRASSPPAHQDQEELVALREIQNSKEFHAFLDVEGSPISWLFQRDSERRGFISESCLKVRQCKRRLKQLLEEHRQEMARREAAQGRTTTTTSSAMASVDKDDQDWYEQSFKLQEKLKKELDDQRLQGDEFKVRIQNVPYILHVSSDSKFYFYMYAYDNLFISNNGSSTRENLNSPGRKFAQMKGKKFMHFIDEVRVATPIDEIAITGDELESRACITLKSGIKYEFLSDERHEILAVIGAHIHRYNLNRVRLVNYLRRLIEARHVKYDPLNPDHERSLMLLWDLLSPEEALENRISKQWSKIGFQGKDPATDFRGMGILGLNMLLYFARQYPEIARKIIKMGKDYPFAVAGINLNQALFELLNLTKETMNLPAGGQQWDTPLFHFLELLYRRPTTSSFPHAQQLIGTSNSGQAAPGIIAGTSDNNGSEQERGTSYELPLWTDSPLEEVYCVAFRLLDKNWDEKKASYMDFPVILAETKRLLGEALAQRPSNLQALVFMLDLERDNNSNGPRR